MSRICKSSALIMPPVKICLVVLLLLATMMVGIGCKDSDNGPVISEEIGKPVKEVNKEPIGPPAHYIPAPLTGMPADPELLQRRPVAVMIENVPSVRPQAGLAKADVVYEILAEGGITRFLALYHSEDASEVGPVRSARPYYIERALEYNALYAYCGGSEAAKQLIKTAKVASLDEFGIGRKGGAYWRIKSRKAPHNLYADTAKLRAVGLEKGYKDSVEVPAFEFLGKDEAVAEGDGPATNIKINYGQSYSAVSYKYLPEKGIYLRDNGTKAHKDSTTGKQLTASNVIVQYANTKVLDSEGRLQVQTIGSGKALLFSAGQVYEGTWQKKGQNSWTVFKYQNGKEYKLLPGQTWIQVVQLKTNVTYE